MKDFNISEIIGEVENSGILARSDKALINENSVLSCKAAVADPFETVFDNLFNGISVVEQIEQKKPAVVESDDDSKSFSRMRTKVSNVRRDDRCLFDHYISGHLRVTGDNAPEEKISAASELVQG